MDVVGVVAAGQAGDVIFILEHVTFVMTKRDIGMHASR